MPEQATELLLATTGVISGGATVQLVIFLLRRRAEVRAMEMDATRLTSSLARAQRDGTSLLDQGQYERAAVLDGVKLLYTRGEIDVDELERRIDVILATEVEHDG